MAKWIAHDVRVLNEYTVEGDGLERSIIAISYDVRQKDSRDEAQATTRLIAAAPELRDVLTALVTLKARTGANWDSDPAWERARALLAVIRDGEKVDE